MAGWLSSPCPLPPVLPLGLSGLRLFGLVCNGVPWHCAHRALTPLHRAHQHLHNWLWFHEVLVLDGRVPAKHRLCCSLCNTLRFLIILNFKNFLFRSFPLHFLYKLLSLMYLMVSLMVLKPLSRLTCVTNAIHLVLPLPDLGGGLGARASGCLPHQLFRAPF